MTARNTIAGSAKLWPDIGAWRAHWTDRVSADVDQANLSDASLDAAQSWLLIASHAADQDDGFLYAFALGQLHTIQRDRA